MKLKVHEELASKITLKKKCIHSSVCSSSSRVFLNMPQNSVPPANWWSISLTRNMWFMMRGRKRRGDRIYQRHYSWHAESTTHSLIWTSTGRHHPRTELTKTNVSTRDNLPSSLDMRVTHGTQRAQILPTNQYYEPLLQTFLFVC